MKKKPSKAKKPASVKSLGPKKLTARQARGVKGGNLMLVCATGEHIKKANITY